MCVAMLGLYGLGAMNAALAARPVNHKTASRLDSRQALDLRPAATTLAAADGTSATFPSSLHRQTLGAHEQIQLPGMGAAGAQNRIPGRTEKFVQRVHQEGLPVARLWENKSALVSLGLNKKGKPGLWIIQKIR